MGIIAARWAQKTSPRIDFSGAELSTSIIVAKSPIQNFDSIQREYRQEPDSSPDQHDGAEILVQTSMSMPENQYHGTRMHLKQLGIIHYAITGNPDGDYSLCRIRIRQGATEVTHTLRLRDGQMRAIPLQLENAPRPEKPYGLIWAHGCHQLVSR